MSKLSRNEPAPAPNIRLIVSLPVRFCHGSRSWLLHWLYALNFVVSGRCCAILWSRLVRGTRVIYLVSGSLLAHTPKRRIWSSSAAQVNDVITRACQPDSADI